MYLEYLGSETLLKIAQIEDPIDPFSKSQNPLDNIHFKRCTDLSFAWSGVMR